MATVLCIWEMGTGLGHLVPMKPFVDRALAEGHKVVLAVRELHNIHLVYQDYPITLYQAPRAAPPVAKVRPLSYPHLLAEHYHSGEQLALLCRGWDAIYDAVEPDLVIYDYAPAAMVAGHHRPFRKWMVGNGFFIPRVTEGLMGVFPGMVQRPRDEDRLQRAQGRLLAMVNHSLVTRGQRGVADLRDLFLAAEHQLLTTLPELDHFGVRPDGDYLGIQADAGDSGLPWPLPGERRVFAYLYDFPRMIDLLRALENSGASTLVYSRDIPQETRAKFPNFLFANKPVDMAMVLARADVMVTMGNHGTVAQGVMAGIPQLLVPSQLEQALLSSRLVRQGRGMIMSRREPDMEAVVSKALTAAGSGRLSYDPARRAFFGGEQLQRRLSDLFAEL